MTVCISIGREVGRSQGRENYNQSMKIKFIFNKKSNSQTNKNTTPPKQTKKQKAKKTPKIKRTYPKPQISMFGNFIHNYDVLRWRSSFLRAPSPPPGPSTQTMYS